MVIICKSVISRIIAVSKCVPADKQKSSFILGSALFVSDVSVGFYVVKTLLLKFNIFASVFSP